MEIRGVSDLKSKEAVMNKLPGRIAGLILILTGALALGAQDLTVKDIIRLKRLGFSDADVKAEVVKAGKPIAVTPADLQALKDAGAGDELIRALQAPVPKPLALADIVRMTRDRQSADQILDAVIASGAKYAITAAEGADLVRQNVDPAVILALKGKPLGVNELKLLAEGHVPEGTFLKLQQTVGFEAVNLTAGDALALDRAGVPEAIVKLLAQPAKPAAPAQPAQQPPANPDTLPFGSPDEHLPALIGTWQGEMTGGGWGEYGQVQLIFTAEGRYILSTNMGAFQRGRWSTEQSLLMLTPDNGMPEGENFELNGNRLRIVSKVGTITCVKVR